MELRNDLEDSLGCVEHGIDVQPLPLPLRGRRTASHAAIKGKLGKDGNASFATYAATSLLSTPALR